MYPAAGAGAIAATTPRMGAPRAMGSPVRFFGCALALVIVLVGFDGAAAQRYPAKKFKDQVVNGTAAYTAIGSKLTQILNEYKAQFGGSGTKLRDALTKDR